MSSELATVDRTQRLEFSAEQRALVRNTFANGANEQEFAVLMEIAATRRLNPFMKQIYFVKRPDKKAGRDVWSCQVSIDGLRAIAERTGKYDGQDEPEYTYNDKGEILSAKVKVYRKDWSRPSVGIAYWDEFVQTTYEGKPTRFWQQMGHVMLGKCAEAQALRKAFPEDMSGLYTGDEMQQAERQREPEIVEQPAPPQLEQQLRASVDLTDKRAKCHEELRSVLERANDEEGISAAKELMKEASRDKMLTKKQFDDLVALGQERKAAIINRGLDRAADNAIGGGAA
jgi:phage recombination protein Bet